MLIYRVAMPSDEDEEIPYGPYRRDYDNREVLELSDLICNAHSSDDQRPPPYSDGLGEIPSQEYCGFTSLHDLKRWFDGWLEKLHDFGFEIYVYNVPARRVRIGGHQVVANLKPEMLVMTKPLIAHTLMEVA